MFQRVRKMFVLPVLAAAALVAFSAGVVRAANVEGKIMAISLAQKTVTIKPVVGHAVTVKVGPSTVVELNGNETTLSALRVGDHGDADYNAKTFLASTLDATGPSRVASPAGSGGKDDSAP
jgi:ABC-type Fe3+-hydroxamate transport system substrate-binding protein